MVATAWLTIVTQDRFKSDTILWFKYASDLSCNKKNPNHMKARFMTPSNYFNKRTCPFPQVAYILQHLKLKALLMVLETGTLQYQTARCRTVNDP